MITAGDALDDFLNSGGPITFMVAVSFLIGFVGVIVRWVRSSGRGASW